MKAKITLLLFVFFTSFLNGSNSIKIDYATIEIENFNVGYILDKNNSLSIDEVQNLKFKTMSNYHSFGQIADILWIRLKIENSTEIEKELFVHNKSAYFSKEISIYECEENILVDQNIYNILKDAQYNRLIGSVLVYPLTIQAKSSKTLYIKILPIVTQIANLNIYDKKKHIKALINKNILSNIIVVILFTLAFYNIILFLFNKKKEFVFYSFYLINAGIGLSYMYGSIFHNLEIYGEGVYWINITAILVSGFLVLFIKSIFDFNKNNKKLDTLLNSVLVVVALNLFVALFIDLQLAIDLVKFLFLYSFTVIYFTAFSLRKQHHPLANIFLIAYTIYIIGFTTTILSLFGIIPISSLFFHASGITLVIEALLFSYLIYYHTKLLETKLTNQQNILILKNQKAQMGDMIGAITHQWKQPLTAISALVMSLQYKLKDNKCEVNYINDKITKINNQTLFLAETIDDFKSFFNPKKIKKESDLAKLINKAISLSKDAILTDEIIIKQDLKFTKKVSVFENELLHIILNIIQNSKEAFRDNNRNSDGIKMIKIIGETKKNSTCIDIIDNAGGISKENLPYIFHENYTTKEKDKGTGLGLYLSKVIIEDHMNGSIEVKNIGNGTMFRIIL